MHFRPYVNRPPLPASSNVAPYSSACPGLLHIVAARDGGLCRIRLPGGTIGAAQLHALASAAERHAGGPVELTNRANLQLRGIRAGHETALSQALLEAGFGPRGHHETSRADAQAADARRNLMLSPAAGRDPDALIDTRALAASLLDTLQNEPRFAALSPKFSVQLDGGERLAMLEHPHDIWFAAQPDGTGVGFAFGLAGCPSPGIYKAGGNMLNPALEASADIPALGIVGPEQVPALLNALLRAFLDLATPQQPRMRDLLRTHAASSILQRAQTYLDFQPRTVRAWTRRIADPALRFGPQPQATAGLWWVGGQPPLGRLDTRTLHALAELAHAANTQATVIVTPWQSILIPDLAKTAVAPTVAAMERLGFICDPQAAYAGLIACAGSSGCAKARADTKADAQYLAEHLPQLRPAALELHLSGCERSCAAAHCAAHTLLAVAPGHYDLYERDGGPGFGRLVAHDLNLEQIKTVLTTTARSPIDV
ncbi:precorrin-3B synthase [Paraburkholderia phenazinium]|uniref:Precorrin-3B synthase n=1 Tax=Paraburkholderia phenazinium TaxID=60549 RepID=A0A1N6K3T7_9BURK|nr:precorrin-3B synthase [Paraburkholderia phenazinium]SIO50987.1 precorrin-3B synthase [Paraburkholderia phenazinium]